MGQAAAAHETAAANLLCWLWGSDGHGPIWEGLPLLQVAVQACVWSMADACCMIPTLVCILQVYACNVLNLGNSRIISAHAQTARQIVRDPHFHGDVQVRCNTCTTMIG